MDDRQILDIARNAALEAGAHLKASYGQRTAVEFKGDIDLVTEKDRQSQDIIHDAIKKHVPGHSILAEEELEIEKDREHLWLVDPIDGTTNFAHSLPMFCVSIAYLVSGVTRVGVVYIPILDEMFCAVKNGGAFLNDEKIRVSPEKDMNNALLATGFPYDRQHSADNNLDHFGRFLLRVRGIRRMGAAAIDLAYTAAGRFEGFWEMKLSPWDTPAGFLLVEEAGGKVTDFSGNPFNPYMQECLASNGHIHPMMLDILQKSKNEEK